MTFGNCIRSRQLERRLLASCLPLWPFPPLLVVGLAKLISLPWHSPIPTPGSFDLLVGVRDSRDLEASTALKVTIVNINDEIPRFTR